MSANTMTQEQEFTASQAAKILRITRQTVVKRIEAGLLRARLEGREYRISESDLEEYRQRTVVRPENWEK